MADPNNIIAFDDQALRTQCDVYCSLDGVAYCIAGTALEPCTRDLPFQLPVDDSLRGTVLYFKFCRIDLYGNRVPLRLAKKHRCTVPDAPELRIVYGQPSLATPPDSHGLVKKGI